MSMYQSCIASGLQRLYGSWVWILQYFFTMYGERTNNCIVVVYMHLELLAHSYDINFVLYSIQRQVEVGHV
jgi:hypothetical protein